MQSVAQSVERTTTIAQPEMAFAQAHWYALYTCANHEKQVAAQLDVRAVEHFLPLYSSVRRWKDRRVTLELPLFPGYVFTRLALRDRLRVLEIPSVVRLVGFSGQPGPAREGQDGAACRSARRSHAKEKWRPIGDFAGSHYAVGGGGGRCVGVGTLRKCALEARGTRVTVESGC